MTFCLCSYSYWVEFGLNDRIYYVEHLTANASTLVLLFLLVHFWTMQRVWIQTPKLHKSRLIIMNSQDRYFYSAKNAAWGRQLLCHLLLEKEKFSFTAHKALWETRFYMQGSVSPTTFCIVFKTQNFVT